MRRYVVTSIVGLTLFALLVLSAMPAFAAQAPQPLVSGFTIDPVGTYERKTGNAVVTGSISCSQDVVIFVTLRLRQNSKNHHADNFGFADVGCTPGEPTTFEALVVADHGRYRQGRARVDTLAEWNDPNTGEYSRDELAAEIRLKKSR